MLNTLETEALKEAKTEFPVMDLIRNRWSTRSFSDTPLKMEEIKTLVEAASWSPSSNNEQPWRFHFGLKGTEKFDGIAASLLPGNAPWASKAAGLLVIIVETEFAASGKPNSYAQHDAGIALGFLLLQARSQNIFAHPMGGFDHEKLSVYLGLSDKQKTTVVLALGYLDGPEKLEEPFKTRELSPRIRKGLDVILLP